MPQRMYTEDEFDEACSIARQRGYMRGYEAGRKRDYRERIEDKKQTRTDNNDKLDDEKHRKFQAILIEVLAFAATRFASHDK